LLFQPASVAKHQFSNSNTDSNTFPLCVTLERNLTLRKIRDKAFAKFTPMNKTGPIIIIEDDLDDQDILTDILKELSYKNEVIFFSDSIKALAYLTNTDIEPFLVLSDINMPKLNGIELREKVHNNEDLRLKSIPYLFFSTSAEQKHVIDAYSRSIQGFFIKPANYEKLKNTIRKIIEYWQECESPNYIKNAQ
jgi:two-component SAPR family response regulator